VTVTGGTYGLENGTIYLTVPAGTTETLTALMEGTSLVNPDDDETDTYGSPWVHPLGVAMKARFKVTTAGVVTEAGTRYLQFRWHDGRDVVKGVVHVGDTFNAEGISVFDDVTSATVEEAITEGSWMWVRIDARNPDYIHGKMWVEGTAYGSGEDAAWDVSISRADSGDDPTEGDFFELKLSAGNVTGADQTLRVGEIWFCGAGDDCQWVEEKIGEGDGSTATFNTSQPFKKQSLWFFVDGFHTRTRLLTAASGQFRTRDGVAPSQNAALIARYLVDRNPSGD
jgi:hypothetical protein